MNVIQGIGTKPKYLVVALVNKRCGIWANNPQFSP